MQTDFRVRDRSELTVMMRRSTVTLGQVGAEVGGCFAEIYGYLGGAGAATAEAPFVIYHGAPARDDRPFDIEICAPVAREIDAPKGWRRVVLPGGTFASVVHVGPYDSLGTAYDELQSWIARQDLAIAGPPREVYLSDPGTPPADIRTVVAFPVVASVAGVPIATP